VSLIDKLLGAILRVEGDGLVMHVGEVPYVMAASGPVPVSSRALTLRDMSGVLQLMLPEASVGSLRDSGAVEHELTGPGGRGERFKVVAARSGDDVWIEVRRQRRAVGEGETRAKIPAGDPKVAQEATSPASAPSAAPEKRWPSVQASECPAVEKPAQHAAVVLPLSRSSIGKETPGRVTTSPWHVSLDRLLRLAAARGAATLYVLPQAAPSVRVDGAVVPLAGEPALRPSEVNSLVMELAPAASRDSLLTGEGTEWICDVPEVGRVRCLTFRDQRGAGGIFRLTPSRLVSMEQLGLPPEVEALLAEPDGLLLVAGPRASGKSTLLSAFVDLINRARSDYVITIEREIRFPHESRSSLVSQREIRGTEADLVAAARAALRENPDVIVIDDLRSSDMASVALDAAASGRLVICACAAPSAAVAVTRLLEGLPAQSSSRSHARVAEALRGVLVQVLLSKAGGGRVAARELMLNTASVAALIAEGKLTQLGAALESGRRHGMIPLNDALVAFVQNGVVEAREAWRKAFDRQALLAQLRREGIDTSTVERLA
jgi:twitching motility protein PilT